MERALPIGRHYLVQVVCQIALAGALLAAAARTLSTAPRHNAPPAPPPDFAVARTVLSVHRLPGRQQVEDIKWSPDGRKLAVAREDGQVLLLPNRKRLWAGGKAPCDPIRLWWSPDGRQLALLRDGVLELLTLSTGQRQVIGDGIFSVAWLPMPHRGRRSSIGGELICIKYADPPVQEIILARISASRGSKRRFIFRSIPMSKNRVPTALSPDGRVLIAGLLQKDADYVHADLSVWHPQIPAGRIRWTRRIGFYYEYPSYARAVWSGPLQAAVVSFAGATDGASFRRLMVVTRTREYWYEPPLYATPAALHSDPVWLGNQVIFPEGGWDDFEATDRKWTNALSSFEVPSGKHRVLFSGADDYRAPAVSPDNRRLVYAAKSRGRWEVRVVAIHPSRTLAVR